MSRYYNYLENDDEFHDAFYIVKKIIRDIKEFDLSLVENKDYFIKLQQEVDEIDKELGDNCYELSKKIRNDLISPRVVNYYYEHNHTYPDVVSPIGDRIVELFRRIFEIEDEVQIICAEVWKKMLTPFEQIENGKPFSIVGHSGMGYIVTTSSSRYRNNDYENTTSYSCSLFNNNSMNTFSSNLVMVFDLNTSNYVSACNFDCATCKVKYRRGVRTLREIDGKIIDAGYMHEYDLDRILTKSECPISIINKINNNPKGQINEFILDKTTSIPSGLIIFSSGYDFSLIEYMYAMRMKHDYNLELKVINKSLYMDSGLTKEEQCNNLYKSIMECLSKFQESEINMVIELLDGFVEDVIIPLKLDEEIERIIIEKIEEIKQLKKFTY